MFSDWLKGIVFFIILLLLQVWVLNKIHLFGIATPLLYIYFVIKLPTGMNRNWVTLLAFLLGLMVDIFNNTSGFNALAAVTAGFFRYYIIAVFSPRNVVETYVPSVNSFGMAPFMRYVIFIVLLHHLIFFMVEAFSFSSWYIMLFKVLGSAILTWILIFAIECFNIKPLNK